MNAKCIKIELLGQDPPVIYARIRYDKLGGANIENGINVHRWLRAKISWLQLYCESRSYVSAMAAVLEPGGTIKLTDPSALNNA